VKFSLTDNEGEAELENDIMNTNIEGVSLDTEEVLDIDNDLSALAADVLGTKSEEKTD
jgi:hypothetical protein